MKRIFLIVLLLAPFFASAQTVLKNIASKVTDTTAYTVPSGYGALRYKNQGGYTKWQYTNNGTTWLDFGSGGGFTLANGNGTTANGSAVDLGGSATANISLSLGAYELAFNGNGNNYGLSIANDGPARLFVRSKYIGVFDDGVNGQIDLTLGSDSTGDTYQRNSSGYLERIPIGTANYVFTSNGTTASWAAPTSGWATTGTTNLTGATTIAGTTTNTLSFSFPSLGVTRTNGAGHWLVNSTAASSGNQQLSPNLVWEGQGWKTTATAASQSVKFMADVLPIQSSTAPLGSWRLGTSINGGAYSDVVTVRSDGVMYLLAGTGSTANLYFGTVGDAFIARSLSGTTGIFTYGPVSTPNIYSHSITSTNGNYNTTSGTGGALGLPGGVNPSSGSANFYMANTTGTINMTGTSSGNVFSYGVNQTVTAARGNYTGFYHNPSVTSITGQHNALHAVTGDVRIDAGNLIMGTGSTTQQGQVIHNVGTTGSDVYRRSVDWTPETVSASSGNEDYNVFLSDGITNSTCTVTVTVVGVSSDGVKSYAKEMKATFRKPGTSDMVQVGSTHDIYEDSNDLTTPSSSVSVSTDFVRVSYDSGTGAPTLRWTIFLTTKYSTN
jgi:hypothetical protein